MSKIKFECGACFHWVRRDEEAVGPVVIGAPVRGICYGGPPTVFGVFDQRSQKIGAQANLRPALAESERACGQFVSAEQMRESANGDMVN
jgi:hypothetical protein